MILSDEKSPQFDIRTKCSSIEALKSELKSHLFFDQNVLFASCLPGMLASVR